MNWKQIAETCPKALDEYCKTLYCDVEYFLEAMSETHDNRKLYDHFDALGIYVIVTPEFYKDGINWTWQCVWYLPKDKWTNPIKGRKDIFRMTDGTGLYGDNHEYPTRTEVESAAFTRAFALREGQKQ